MYMVPAPVPMPVAISPNKLLKEDLHSPPIQAITEWPWVQNHHKRMSISFPKVNYSQKEVNQLNHQNQILSYQRKKSQSSVIDAHKDTKKFRFLEKEVSLLYGWLQIKKRDSMLLWSNFLNQAKSLIAQLAWRSKSKASSKKQQRKKTNQGWKTFVD